MPVNRHPSQILVCGTTDPHFPYNALPVPRRFPEPLISIIAQSIQYRFHIEPAFGLFFRAGIVPAWPCYRAAPAVHLHYRERLFLDMGGRGVGMPHERDHPGPPECVQASIRFAAGMPPSETNSSETGVLSGIRWCLPRLFNELADRSNIPDNDCRSVCIISGLSPDRKYGLAAGQRFI